MKIREKSEAVLLETQYLSPVSMFVMLKSFSEIRIDGEENFRKSTWRNRCRIINANGPLLLTIPLMGGRGVHLKTKDVRIANDEPWQKKHWRSFTSAYGNSSYFVFYEDTFRKFYEKEYAFLTDLNTDLLALCLKILDLRIKILNSEAGENITPSKLIPDNVPAVKPYHQVFQTRHGFIADVSVIDLIFNSGPEAGNYIRG